MGVLIECIRCVGGNDYPMWGGAVNYNDEYPHPPNPSPWPLSRSAHPNIEKVDATIPILMTFEIVELRSMF